MIHRARALWRDEDGVTTIEYALVLTLMAVAAIAAWAGVGGHVLTSADDSNARIGNAVASPGG